MKITKIAEKQSSEYNYRTQAFTNTLAQAVEATNIRIQIRCESCGSAEFYVKGDSIASGELYEDMLILTAGTENTDYNYDRVYCMRCDTQRDINNNDFTIDWD